MSISHERLTELLDYNPDTGIFTWKKCKRKDMVGKQAGSTNPDGWGIPYTLIGLDNCKYRAHRLAWFYHYGVWPDKQIDHINRDSTDNRICNLREVTNSENARNRKIQSNNTSGATGVQWDIRAGKWLSRIKINGKLIHIGLFDNFEEAVAARKEEAKKHGFTENHGE